jgi:hypothetical protein
MLVLPDGFPPATRTSVSHPGEFLMTPVPDIE